MPTPSLRSVVGIALLALGTAGILYAPAIVAAQRRQGMAPLADDETLDPTDRIRVTRWTSVVIAAVGLGLLAFGLAGP